MKKDYLYPETLIHNVTIIAKMCSGSEIGEGDEPPSIKDFASDLLGTEDFDAKDLFGNDRWGGEEEW